MATAAMELYIVHALNTCTATAATYLYNAQTLNTCTATAAIAPSSKGFFSTSITSRQVPDA
jgi:hypothetical protein